MSSLEGIAAAPPSFSTEAVADAVDRQFGYRGDFRPLVSERDQNFSLLATDGTRFLVKVTSATEVAATTELQVSALRHIERFVHVIAPRVVPTLEGEAWGRIDAGGAGHRLRLLSWVEGEQLETLGVDADLAAAFGRALGRLDTALAGYDYEGANPVLLWDLQRVGELRSLLHCIDEEEVRARVEAAIDDFDHVVVPAQCGLRRQLIHADANPENVLVCNGNVGFIDFSDIVRAPRCFELGIAASYLRAEGDDPLMLVRPFVAGYQAVAALECAEVDVLFELVRARLATSITLLYWRLRDRPPSDEYRRKSLQLERNASHFLVALDTLGRERFLNEIKRLVLSD